MTLFGPFAEVPFYPLVFPLFWGAVVFFCLAMARHLRVFAAVRAEGPSPFADVPRRFVGLIRYAFIQTKMFKDARAGLMHAGIFWGFVLLTIGTANVVTGGIIAGLGRLFWRTRTTRTLLAIAVVQALLGLWVASESLRASAGP